ncbi:putative DsbA family dithiol-disulfide isomerase [Aminobacter aminovorans]|uniref:DSBA-like thioredoxin domain n=1 Tax=Aminobacter aminovorans TaxID=83263 RepID=A0A380WHN8_AMIAI|nr:DsbA family oxidoreductase [Aminobacter aminovorans]TCS26646.1 putative DsbA family dithiol-disulfide isomerase [Aminobacter aminovorans]SUU88295.1 DSBA-like thioredoxin domain [Aminobacter aminovorans]
MRIEIHADVLCPWSYIAKRRLEAASALAGAPIEIVWRSFELSPEGGPIPGDSAADMIRQWRGDAAEARIAQITALGAAEGTKLDLENARPVNSFDAHRLVHLGAAAGKADAVMERLLRAYHSEAENIAVTGVLNRLGREAGLDPRAVADLLAGEEFVDAVRADKRLAIERGISGVPVMVLPGAAPTSAVKPVAELVGLLREAAASEPGT